MPCFTQNSQRTLSILRQKQSVATQRRRETMRHTDVFRIVERRGAEVECRVSRKTYKEPQPYFASKAISCNATTERDDVAYWRIPHCRTTRRGSKWLLFTKMIQRAKLLFCQKRYYATQAMSRRTGHTRGISRSARRVRGSRMPFFTKKKIKVFRHRQDPPHRPDRGRYRSARSTPRRRRRTRGCTSARRCVEERSRHPVRWL